MIEAVIFDTDGTLIDSVDLHAQAWQDAFAHFGFPFDFEKIRSQIGKGGDQLLPEFLSKDQIEMQGEAIQEFRGKHFKEKYFSDIRPFPCVRELFERIGQSGKKVGLASSAKEDELREYAKLANVDDLLDFATSSSDAENSKPHPDIFDAALSRLEKSTPHDNVLVVGDTPHDAVAAGRAGLKTIGVLCGGFSEQDLRDSGCIAIYRDPEDLLLNFESSPLNSR